MINKYPYTDFHELNLDWILREIRKLHHDYDEFKALNTITNAGAWDITKQYQAWTVVSDNNVGYISLKPVPAGIAITNTEYWGLIADYDILITDLSNRISALEYTVGNHTTELANHETRITTLEADPEMIIVGDSWMDPSQGGVEVLPHLEKLLNIKAANIHDYAIGGTGFCKNYLTNFVDQLTGSVNDPAVTASKVKYVIAYGGTNDWGVGITGVQYAAAMNTMQSIVNTYYPNAELYIFFMQAAVGRTYEKDLINWVQATAGANVINASWPISLLEYADNLHPTATGYKEVARFIAANILGYEFRVKTVKSDLTSAYNTTFAGGTLQADDFNVVASWDENKIDLFIYFNFTNVHAGSLPFGSVTIPNLGIPTLPFASANPLTAHLMAVGVASDSDINVQLSTNDELVINGTAYTAGANALTLTGTTTFIWANSNH